jgi:hypothetical protein
MGSSVSDGINGTAPTVGSAPHGSCRRRRRRRGRLLQPGQDLDASTLRAPSARRLHGDAVAHDVGVLAAGLVDEAAGAHAQHVGALVEQHAHGQALVLAQLLGHRAVEAQPRGDLVGDDFRRDAADARLPRLPLPLISPGMPTARSRAKLSAPASAPRAADRSITLSSCASLATLARSATNSWPTWPSTGDFTVELADLALQVLHQQHLARVRLLLGLHVELQAVVLRMQAGLGMGERDARLLERVARVVDLHAGRGAGVEGLLLAREVGLGGLDVDRRVVARALQRGALLVGVDLRAQRVGLQRVGLRRVPAPAWRPGRGCRSSPAPGPS